MCVHERPNAPTCVWRPEDSLGEMALSCPASSRHQACWASLTNPFIPEPSHHPGRWVMRYIVWVFGMREKQYCGHVYKHLAQSKLRSLVTFSILFNSLLGKPACLCKHSWLYQCWSPLISQLDSRKDFLSPPMALIFPASLPCLIFREVTLRWSFCVFSSMHLTPHLCLLFLWWVAFCLFLCCF